jgi:hypothetical protein
MEFRPASINGRETDFKEIAQGLGLARKLLAQAAAERDRARKEAKRKESHN